MRRTIELTIRDENGASIGQPQKYELNLKEDTFSEIEQQVEGLKQIVLSEIERELLEEVQTEFIKTHQELKRNGRSEVKIKGLHGSFKFKEQWFTTEQGENQSYFDLSGQFQAGHQSEGLKELVTYYSNRLSYTEVSQLVERISGEKLLSDQKIEQLVINKAAEVSQEIAKKVKESLSTGTMPAVNTQVAIYEAGVKEVLLFEDGIQVKEQKENREKTQEKETGSDKPEKDDDSRHRVNHHVVIVEKKEGDFEYITELSEGSVTLVEAVQSQLIVEYGQKPQAEALNIVAITDGASNIRLHMVAIFGVIITIILDWYHLDKKVRQLFSMIARNKTEEEHHIQVVQGQLW